MPASVDDGLLQTWVATHDEPAFRELCARHTGLVASLCRRLGSPDPDEATQAVFLVLARRAGSVAGPSLACWLGSTARRVVADQRRAAASRRRHEQEAAVEHARHRDAAPAEPAWAEARAHLDAALASLSTARREAVLRFYLEGRSQAEVAAELGCTEGAVKTRVHEGIERLRAFFARKGVALGSAALTSGLAGESAAAEPALAASCAQTAFTPAIAPGAATLATGVATAMSIKTASLACAAVLVAGSAITAALVMGAEVAPTGNPPALVVAPGDAERAEIDALIDIAVKHGLPETRGATAWSGSLSRQEQGRERPIWGYHLKLTDGRWLSDLAEITGPSLFAPPVTISSASATQVAMSRFLEHTGLEHLSASPEPDAALTSYENQLAYLKPRLAPSDQQACDRLRRFRFIDAPPLSILLLWRAGHPAAPDLLRLAAVDDVLHSPLALPLDAPLNLMLEDPPYRDPEKRSPSYALNRRQSCIDALGDAPIRPLSTVPFVQRILGSWALGRLLQAGDQERPTALAAAIALAGADVRQIENLHRVAAACASTGLPRAEDPLPDRLAAWEPPTYFAGSYMLSQPLLLASVDDRSCIPAPWHTEAWELKRRIFRLQHEGRNDEAEASSTRLRELAAAHARPIPELQVGPQDADGLVGLLGDQRPSRWVDRGVARTLGDNALRALAHLIQRDPRSMVGKPTDTPWSNAERDLCATAITAWWQSKRMVGVDGLLAESLASMPVDQALNGVLGMAWDGRMEAVRREDGRVRRGLATNPSAQDRLCNALAQGWLAHPPKAEDLGRNRRELAGFAMRGRRLPTVKRFVDALQANDFTPPWPMFPVCWKALHGDRRILDLTIEKYLAENDPPAGGIAMLLSLSGPTGRQLEQALSFLDEPVASVRFQDSVATIADVLADGPFDNPMTLLRDRQSAGRIALRLALGWRLLGNQQPVPSDLTMQSNHSNGIWVSRYMFIGKTHISVPRRAFPAPTGNASRMPDTASDLRWCDLAAWMLHGFAELGLPATDFDLSAPLPQRDATIAALRPLVEARAGEALKAVGLNLPAEPARNGGMEGF